VEGVFLAEDGKDRARRKRTYELSLNVSLLGICCDTEGLVEIAKIVGALSVAIISMSVVTYALAVPRLQQRLASSIKLISGKKTDLQEKMRKENVTIKDVEVELREIDKDREKIEGDVARLSWKKVVGVPAICAVIALGFVFLVLESAGLYDVYSLLGSFAASLFAFSHLLWSLRLIEQTVVKMSQEGMSDD